MKKFVVMGALALVLAAGFQQTALAWINAKFGVGLNWSYQSGGNNLAWGVFRNGQPPAPCDGPGFYGHGYGAPDYFHAQGHQGYPYAQGTETPPVPTPAGSPATRTQPTSSLDYPGYQNVSYPMYYPTNYFIPVNYGQ